MIAATAVATRLPAELQSEIDALGVEVGVAEGERRPGRAYRRAAVERDEGGVDHAVDLLRRPGDAAEEQEVVADEAAQVGGHLVAEVQADLRQHGEAVVGVAADVR